jgi:hypothetical protein
MSQRAFAEAHSIPLSTFSYWLRNHIEPVEPTLVPVHVARARPSTTPIDILLPNDVVVRIAGDCDPSVLTNVLRAIDAAC